MANRSDVEQDETVGDVAIGVISGDDIDVTRVLVHGHPMISSRTSAVDQVAAVREGSKGPDDGWFQVRLACEHKGRFVGELANGIGVMRRGYELTALIGHLPQAGYELTDF